MYNSYKCTKMKKLIYISFALAVILLAGCFSDEGNYDYEEIKRPTWNINIETQLQPLRARGGSEVTFDGTKYFRWVGFDSLQRAQEVRYEWRMNGKVICTELKETFSTDDLMKRAGFEEYPNQAQLGHFVIIEKKTGMEYMCRFRLTITPPISPGDFIVYSEKGNKVGTLSVLMLDYLRNGVAETENFQLNQGISGDIPGTPKSLSYANANNVSYAGSVTAITQEGGATVFNVGEMKKVWELSEQFSEGTPPDFLVSDRRDQEESSDHPAFTWVATQDGRVFTRQTGKYYLGGKILSEPYYVDSKGYKITKFGHTLWGITNIPCYDEKNRRVLLATCLPYSATKTYRCFISVLENASRWSGVKVSNMPQDAKVYYMSNCVARNGSFIDYNTSWYEIYYTSKGDSWVGTFSVDVHNRRLLVNSQADRRFMYFNTVNFTDETVFLTSAQIRYRNSSQPLYSLFTQGNKIFAIKKDANGMNSDLTLLELPFDNISSKITCMTYDYSGYGVYKHLIVGCENGDILIFNASELREPKFIKKFNIGGRVASVKQVGAEIMRSNLDMY